MAYSRDDYHNDHTNDSLMKAHDKKKELAKKISSKALEKAKGGKGFMKEGSKSPFAVGGRPVKYIKNRVLKEQEKKNSKY